MDSYLYLPAAMEKTRVAKSRDGSLIRQLGALVKDKSTHRQMSLSCFIEQILYHTQVSVFFQIHFLKSIKYIT